jgi:hypothetical protein
MLTAAVRDLHLSVPGQFLTDVRTSCPDLWRHNPYLTPLDEADPDVTVVPCHYPLIHDSDRLPYHFVHGFRLYLSQTLGVAIEPQAFRGDVYLSEEERALPPPRVAGRPDGPYWVVVAGGKTDFTAKWWDPARYQAVVDHFAGRIAFVQAGGGSPGHAHPRLRGVIDLVGRTTLREFLRLVYHADGVVCPVTLAMHAAAAVPLRPGRRRARACVVVAGGREPPHWEAYPHHQFLHTVGCLPCCGHGGCWKSRVVPLHDGDGNDASLCERPVQLPGSGPTLPRCLDMISTRQVIEAVERYTAVADTT